MKRKFAESNRGAEISLLGLGKTIKVSRRKDGLTDTLNFDNEEDANECFDDWVED